MDPPKKQIFEFFESRFENLTARNVTKTKTFRIFRIRIRKFKGLQKRRFFDFLGGLGFIMLWSRHAPPFCQNHAGTATCQTHSRKRPSFLPDLPKPGHSDSRACLEDLISLLWFVLHCSLCFTLACVSFTSAHIMHVWLQG